MSNLVGILHEFESDLKRVRELLGLIKSFREFGSSSPPGMDIEWQEAVALKGIAPTVRTDLPLISGSMVLYLCGRFEYFVRQVIESMVDEIANQVTHYENLPNALRDELKRRTLEVVKTPSKYGFSSDEADALLIGLAENLNGQTGGGSIIINSKVLSITESNMRAEVFSEVMKRVGMKEIWKDIGKQAKLKLFLQKQADGECTEAARVRLNDLMKDRNQIAHPTGGTSFPDPDKVLWITEYLEAFAAVLVELCDVHLSAFVANAASTVPDPYA
ncbi:HEPN domain-containing protein [Actinomadura kijaniata]|uniref:HEPN domain-containing protein n=1 Tax=Actinomadura kijaniata TaxID=46161 RepID=UPI003F1A51F9